MFIKYNNLRRFLFFDSTSTDIGKFLGILCQENLLYQHNQAGSSSVDQSMCDDNISSAIMKNNHCSIADIHVVACEQSYQKLVSPLYGKCLESFKHELLTELYHAIYPCVKIEWISRFYQEAKKLIVNGEEYLSKKSKSECSAAVVAQWASNNGIDTTGQAEKRVGIITSFIRHTIRFLPKGTSDNISKEVPHILAKVKWFEPHPSSLNFGPSVLVVASTFCGEPTSATFIPISRISARCTYRETSYTFDFDFGVDKIVVCVPMMKKY